MKHITLLALTLLLPLSGFAQAVSDNRTAAVIETIASADSIGRTGVAEAKEKTANRKALILLTAKSLNYKWPENAVSLIPANVTDSEEIITILKRAAQDDPNLTQKSGFCDPNYTGDLLSFTHFASLTLDDLLLQIHRRFGVGFLVGPEVGQLGINIKAEKVPWNTLLNSQLFVLGVRATCIDSKTIQLVKNSSLPSLQNTAEVKTRFIKLRFLQPSSSGSRDVAGRSSGGGGGGGGGGGCKGGGQGGGQGGGGQGGSQGCGNFEKLLFEIEKILGLSSATSSSGGGGGGGAGAGAGQQTEAVRTNRSLAQIPGRNILAIRGTDDELELINQIIEKADRPPFQVVIKGLVYTANENRLRDLGVQTTITAGTADGRSNSGIFGHTLGAAGTLFDFSTLIGTTQFKVEANALQQNGVIAIKSRPFAVVLDGDSTELEVGRQIPVLTQGSNVGGQAGNLEFIGASNLLSVTPRVIDDDNGKPIAVNLELQLESNEVDTAVVSQGVPSVNRRSIQSRLILNQDKTVILGGFTVDSLSEDVSKTPGLGDIPILGYLFKRKVKRGEVNRLYFAISVEVIPFGQVIEPVVVPGATTDIPTVLPEMLKPVKGINAPVVSKPPDERD